MSKRVAVLIAAPQAHVPHEIASRIADQLQTAADWLSPNRAVQFACGAVSEAELRDMIGTAPIDVAIVPTENRRKRVLIADMDSTVIEQECIDELAAEVGRRDEVASVTERAMRGEIAFDEALRSRVATLRGLSVDAVDRVLATRVHIRSGARSLVATMRRDGAHTMLVSGGFTLFTGPIAAKVGFAEHRANVLDVANDRFAGTVSEPILGREAKLEALTEALQQRGLAFSDALAVGDGANDLAMVEAAGLGVALHAKPAVGARADVRIEHGDLSALLYLQGYRDEEIVAA